MQRTKIVNSISEKKLLVRVFGAKCRFCKQLCFSDPGYFITKNGLECLPCKRIEEDKELYQIATQ